MLRVDRQSGQSAQQHDDEPKSANKLAISNNRQSLPSKSMDSATNTDTEIENQESEDDVDYQITSNKVKNAARKNHSQKYAYGEFSAKEDNRLRNQETNMKKHVLMLESRDQKHDKFKARFEEPTQNELQIFEESEKTFPNLPQPNSAMYKRVNARGLFADVERENLCPIDALNGIMTERLGYVKKPTSQVSYSQWLMRPTIPVNKHLQWRL